VYALTWKNVKHRAQWGSTLREYAFKKLGARPVDKIDNALITETLSPIWQTKQETAARVKQRIERIITWVKDGKPLPQQGVAKRTKHHAAMPVDEMPDFMAKLRDKDSASSTRDAEGQSLAYVYARETRADAYTAKVLTTRLGA
jgi:lysyl-tRNA synthetase class I